ncbi:tripartite tricarboxylate transporter substrate binding protein [Bordetella petrii]|nr:tripartite tricarboxylate transporter substrate binding protein [Bordetella petrii]
MRRLAALGAACVAAMLITAGLARTAGAAAAYPSGPVRVIVPYPPGGPADIVARSIAAKLAISLGQPFVVENRSGAGGNIGTEEVARAAPDGQTLLLGTNGPLVVNRSLYAKLPFDPQKNFAPITEIAEIPLVLLAHPSVPVNNVQELIAYAKAHPGQLNYGSSGAGSGGHLAGALLAQRAGIDLAHIPYRGMAPATTALLAGHVKLMVGGLLAAMPSLQNGSLKGLAVVTAKRASFAPDIPTVAESGLPGFQIVSWYGLLAPAGTPPAIVQKLHDAVIDALNQPDIHQRLFVDGGLEKIASTPQQFAAQIAKEIPEYAAIVKMTGAKVE